MNARLQPVTVPASAGLQWNLDSVVAELRDVRVRSLADRQRTADQPPRLPSRKALVGILDGLSAVLFPNRLGAPELTDEGIDKLIRVRIAYPTTPRPPILPWGSPASGGRKSAVSAPADIADAFPRFGKQGADAPRSRNDRAVPTARGEFSYRL